jgi:hypothetical protein
MKRWYSQYILIVIKIIFLGTGRTLSYTSGQGFSPAIEHSKAAVRLAEERSTKVQPEYHTRSKIDNGTDRN